jgi:hypothetical protein
MSVSYRQEKKEKEKEKEKERNLASSLVEEAIENDNNQSSLGSSEGIGLTQE